MVEITIQLDENNNLVLVYQIDDEPKRTVMLEDEEHAIRVVRAVLRRVWP